MTGPDTDVVIVGAGIAGISMAAHLQDQCPDRTFVVLEKRNRLGGTWDLFHYPGVRSDSGMQTLGFSFEPWDSDDAIAAGGDILDYLGNVVAKRGLDSRIRYNSAVSAADWHGDEGLWHVTIETPKGWETLRARWLYMATGYYDYEQPYDAKIAGLEDFEGQVVHPQFWPEDLDYSGKHVVVIGSGATAVTIVPAMADMASHVTMLQRTPTWMASKPSRDKVSNFLRRVLPRKPAYWLSRKVNTLIFAAMYKAARKNPEAAANKLTSMTRKELGEHYKAKDFTPPYNPWEQRLCLVPDSDFFKAIKQGKASVRTAHVDKVEAKGIRLDDGSLLEADIIITATGLQLSLGGKIDVTLEGKPVTWGEEFFYRGCMISNVPNLTFVFGYLNNSFTLRADNTSAYTCRVLDHLRAVGRPVAVPRPPADGLVEGPLFPFSSGYLMREIHQLPKSTDSLPWRLNHDYLADCRDFRRNPVADGNLSFEGTVQSPVEQKADLA